MGNGEELRDSRHLAGFIDDTAGILHYFSIGELPITADGQDEKEKRHAFMSDGVGGGVAYKHQQIVEFLPFFVHPDYIGEEQIKALCRVPHYLRTSPAWIMGNIVFPYPMHIAEDLINDQLCILGLND